MLRRTALVGLVGMGAASVLQASDRGLTDAEWQTVERLMSHVDWAEAECQKAAERAKKGLTTFFADARKGLPAFVDDALGWTAKWWVLVDQMPWSHGENVQLFLKQQFAEHVFSQEDFEAAIRRSITGYVSETNGIHNTMLVRMQADIADPTWVRPAHVNVAKIDERLAQSLQSAKGTAQNEAIDELSRLALAVLVEKILARVVAAIAVRMGVSGSILGASAAAAPWSLGTSVIIGLIIDLIIGWIWDWVTDPRGTALAALTECLEKTERAAIEGLVDGLEPYAKDKAVWRRHVLQVAAKAR